MTNEFFSAVKDQTTNPLNPALIIMRFELHGGLYSRVSEIIGPHATNGDICENPHGSFRWTVVSMTDDHFSAFLIWHDLDNDVLDAVHTDLIDLHESIQLAQVVNDGGILYVVYADSE